MAIEAHTSESPHDQGLAIPRAKNSYCARDQHPAITSPCRVCMMSPSRPTSKQSLPGPNEPSAQRVCCLSNHANASTPSIPSIFIHSTLSLYSIPLPPPPPLLPLLPHSIYPHTHTLLLRLQNGRNRAPNQLRALRRIHRGPHARLAVVFNHGPSLLVVRRQALLERLGIVV